MPAASGVKVAPCRGNATRLQLGSGQTGILMQHQVSLILQMVRTLDALGIPYRVGGSIASSIHGVPRNTLDVDFVVDLGFEQVAPLVAALESEFYVDDEMIRSAIRHRTSFNVIDLNTLDKADF